MTIINKWWSLLGDNHIQMTYMMTFVRRQQFSSVSHGIRTSGKFVVSCLNWVNPSEKSSCVTFAYDDQSVKAHKENQEDIISQGYICKFNKFGYCKFGNKCYKKHENKECEKKNCDVKSCPLRHPRKCRFFEEYSYCKFGTFCRFNHKLFNDEESVQQIEKLKTDLQRLETEITEKDDEIKMKQYQIKDLEEKNKNLEIDNKQAQLRLCKLGPGTVLIFYKSFAPTSIYM